MSIFGAEINAAQLRDMRREIAKLDLPQKKRQRFIWRMAKYGVIPAAKRNVRNQQAPDGTAWQGRKTRRRGKMLRNMPGLLHIREMPEIDAVRLYLRGGDYGGVNAGVVGYAHQEGMKTTVRARKSRARNDPGRMASAAQAKKLRKLGYKVRRGVRWRKPPLKEITEKMSFSQAGLLIRKLSGKASKAAWTIDIPARQFVGMRDDDFNKALARQLQAIGYGADVRAQDIRGSV
ncbi:hypothetical protein ACFL9S_18050 [Erwinia sp. AnSW2-5]|uniref:hypothetical protein n=1 Tax=Erwinia sp. AnSW2-5 TaxID=3367692 RepID=UPI00385BFC1D